MAMRRENLHETLEGKCAKCKHEFSGKQEWHDERLYLVGICGTCKYDNHVLLHRAHLR